MSEQRLMDYESDGVEYWGSVNDLPRHEFKQLKRQWSDDIKNQIIAIEKTNEYYSIDYKKHYKSRQCWITIFLWLEIIKFQNRLTLNQVVQLIEIAFDYLEPIYQKILYVRIVTMFDWVDEDGHNRQDKVKQHLLKTSNYSEHEFHLSYNWLQTFTKNKDLWGKGSKREELSNKAEWVLNNPTIDLSKVEEEDLKLIESNDYITAYRGYLLPEKRRARMFNKQEVEDLNKKSSEDISYLYYLPSTVGVSFTLDKFIAHYFAFYSEYGLASAYKEQGHRVRAVVGKYKIRTSDIFTYTNARHEREILLRQHARNTKNDCRVFLTRYEFFTNLDGKFGRSGGYYQGDNTRPKPNVNNYASDRKIMKVFK